MKEHGDYVVGRSKQLVLFSGRGPWNDETMRRGSRETGLIIKQIDKTKPWGQISYLSGESIMPPSTFSAFIKQIIIRKENGMTALAVVIKDSNIINTIKSQLTQAYDSVDIEHKFLSGVDEALDWLEQLSIQVDRMEVHAFFNQHSFAQLKDIDI